jgi:hypothetical protein
MFMFHLLVVAFLALIDSDLSLTFVDAVRIADSEAASSENVELRGAPKAGLHK